MKIIINSKHHQLEICYGKRAVFTYDVIVELSGKNPLRKFIVTHIDGTLLDGERISLDVNSEPVFNVQAI